MIERKLVELTEEGLQYVNHGTSEFKYASGLEVNKPVNKEEYDKSVGADLAKIGFGKAMQRKWVQLDPADKKNVIRIADGIEDTERDTLRKFTEENDLEKYDKKVVDLLKKRQLVNVVS